MTYRLTLSQLAAADLDAIWDSTAERWGTGQAEIYVRQLWADMQIVAANPAVGRVRDDIRTGYLYYRSGSHYLFYRCRAGQVDVIRILHERMDFPRHL